MVDHPAARALTGYLLVRGGVHQVAYARAVERLTGADLTKLFPSPRIPTDKIPECQPHIAKGEHTKLYRFSPSDYLELAAVFNGPHPETGEELVVVDDMPDGVAPFDLPAQEGVFAPDYAPEEIAEIARKLRQRGGPAGRADRRRSQRHQRGRRQGQGRRLLAMATLTKLESKLARGAGACDGGPGCRATGARHAGSRARGAGQEARAVARRGARDPAPLHRPGVDVQGQEDGDPRRRLARSKHEAAEMRDAYLGDEDDPLDGFEFLTMAEAGEVGHWSIVAKLNERAANAELRKLTEWALPIQQRHFQEVLDGSLKLAAAPPRPPPMT